MANRIDRARELVPTIILTVLSMIQALALEFFWARAAGIELLWQGGWPALVGWLQVFIVLDGILLIWVGYVSFVLRFTWLPTLPDMIMPFIIGLLEFAMIEIMHPDNLGPWLILLAVAFAASVYSGHLTTTSARQDPHNAYFFDQVPDTGWRNYRESILAVSVMALLGAVIWWIDNTALHIVALLTALVALTYQFRQMGLFWLHSLEESEAQG